MCLMAVCVQWLYDQNGILNKEAINESSPVAFLMCRPAI